MGGPVPGILKNKITLTQDSEYEKIALHFAAWRRGRFG